ncbi:MAG: biopolymer transporter ExbD [Deltaproteobacteria bacterium]|nr:biopolymer transporter ExbD [Deltaproteobacteria bacterium]
MRFSQPKREEISLGVSIAPLIDIVFLLLIFFMLTSHIEIIPGIDITLPDITERVSDTSTENVIVALDKEGNYYFNKEMIGFKELFRRLKETAQPKKTHLILQADRDVKHGQVVRVMDMAKKAGIQSIVISAQWEPEKIL